MKPTFYLVMGVAGSGKSSLGKALANRLGWEFYDADDFHPPENISKMSSGIPLNDDDRAPWLASLHDLIGSSLRAQRPGVLACSALKERYRQTLLAGNPGVQIVYLKGDYDLLWARMLKRPGHYMKAQMLQSQFDALEEPQDALILDIALPVDELVEQVVNSSFGR